MQQRLVEAGLLKGKPVAIEVTTLEATAGMRSIRRRDTDESHQAFGPGMVPFLARQGTARESSYPEASARLADI